MIQAGGGGAGKRGRGGGAGTGGGKVRAASCLQSCVRTSTHCFPAPALPPPCSRAGCTAVVPRDSSWFGFFDGSTLVPLRKQALYTEDWLGLRQLDARGALLLEEADGAHMEFTLQWFADTIISRFLA